MSMNNLYKHRTITCEGCGKTVTKRMPEKRRFCSHECYMAMPKPERMSGKMMPCGVCSEPVYITKGRLLHRETFFCSPEHANDYQSRNKVGLVCKTCNKDYRVSPSRMKWDNPQYCSMKCRDSDPDVKTRLLEINAAQQRGKQTKPERIGYGLLDDLNIEYLPQYTINDKFIVDAFIPSSKTVIQFDGNYWHGSVSEFPNPDIRQRKRMGLDKSQDSYLGVCGYGVIRIWESDLLHNITEVRSRLLMLLGECESHDEQG